MGGGCGDGQYGRHVHDELRVLAARGRWKQLAVDIDMRVLDDILRKLGDPDQLHVVRRQADMTFRRGVDIGGFVQSQHRHIVHPIRGRVVAKMHMSGEGVLDRLLEQAGSITQDATRESQERPDE